MAKVGERQDCQTWCRLGETWRRLAKPGESWPGLGMAGRAWRKPPYNFSRGGHCTGVPHHGRAPPRTTFQEEKVVRGYPAMGDDPLVQGFKRKNLYARGAHRLGTPAQLYAGRAHWLGTPAHPGRGHRVQFFNSKKLYGVIQQSASSPVQFFNSKKSYGGTPHPGSAIVQVFKRRRL